MFPSLSTPSLKIKIKFKKKERKSDFKVSAMLEAPEL